MERPNLKRTISIERRNLSWQEPMRPFISSTFKDFEEERDHLVRRIFPQLNSLCHSKGTYFAPVDLRWGINEEQAQSGHVVSLCLDYINQCTPFFICLLGERYGSHRPNDSPSLPASYRDLPDDAHWLDMNFLRAAANGHKWVLQDAYQRSSMTELEIIQAAFLNDSKYCRFYFRDVRHTEQKLVDLPENEREEKLKHYFAEDEEAEERVTDLKRRIVARGLPVKFFMTTEELGLQVLNDWLAIINDVYPTLENCMSNVDSELFREWSAHEAYAETRRRVFIQTDAIKNLTLRLDQHGESAVGKDRTVEEMEYGVVSKSSNDQPADPKSIMALVGERGCGKSAIMANWVKSFQKHNPEIKVVTHFVGSSALSSDISSFMRRATYELREEYAGMETKSSGDTEDLSNFHRICEAFVAAISLGPCVLVLDGIDELGPTFGLDIHQVKQLPWLPISLPEHCKMVFSTVRSDLTYKFLDQREDTTICTAPLFENMQDKSWLIMDSLAVHCKHLDQSQVDKVAGSKLSGRPLYLSILANELRVGGTYRNLGNLLEQYIKADSFRDLWRCVIDRWTRDYGWSLDGRSSVSSNSQLDDLSGWVSEMLKLIACSRHGLSVTELMDILGMMGYTGQLGVTPFDFAMLRSATFDALFERPGGLMNFFHQHLREAVEFFLLGILGGSGLDSPASSAVNFLPRSGQHHLKRQCHELLAKYFWNQPHSLRRTEELAWQLEKCGDMNGLLEVVTDPDVFLTMCGDGSQQIALRLDLLRYWQQLMKAGHDPAVAYVHMVERAADNAMNPSQQHIEQTTTRYSTQSTVSWASNQQDEKDLKTPGKPMPNKLSVIEERDDLVSMKQEGGEKHLEAQLNTTLPLKEGEEQEESISEVEGEEEDDESLFYEYKPEERCKLALLGMHGGKFLAEKAYFDQSESLLTFAVEDIRKVLRKYPLSTAEEMLLVQVQESLADVQFYQLHTVQALKYYEKALNTLGNIPMGETDAMYQYLMETKGRLLNRVGSLKSRDCSVRKGESILMEARDCMRRANSIAGLATTQYNLGQLKIQRKNDYEGGEICLRDALKTRERWNGMSHPLVAEVLDELAGVLCNTRNIEGFDSTVAEAYYRRALKIRQQSFGPDHLLVATTLFHLGKLLKCSGSHQCKTEAVTFLKHALDIRTNKLGSEHKLTHAVRRVLKLVQKELKVGDYDYAPVKKPDKRTKDNPNSALSWHYQDLEKFDKRSLARRARSQRAWRDSEFNYQDRTNSGSSRMGVHETPIGSDNKHLRHRAQSAPIGEHELGNGVLESRLEQDLHIVQSSPDVMQSPEGNYGHESNVSLGRGKTQSGRLSQNGNHTESRSKSATSWRRTPSHSASTRISGYSQFTESRPATSFTRGSGRSRNNQRSDSRISHAAHERHCDVPHQFAIHPSNVKAIRGPHNQVRHLLGDPPCPRDLEIKVVHKAAWYHKPNRYPKDAYDMYPPRRHQVRPDNRYMWSDIVAGRDGQSM